MIERIPTRARQLTMELPDTPGGGFVFDLIVTLAHVFDHDGHQVLGHAFRTAMVADTLYTRLTDGEIDNNLFLAALLLDIGGSHLSPHVVRRLQNRPDALSQKSDVDIFFHAVWAADLLNEVPGLRDVSKLIRMHHEHIGGNGYPKGLRGSEIPLRAQVLRIADAFDLAMQSENRNVSAALEHLQLLQGDQFSESMYTCLVGALQDDLGQRVEDAAVTTGHIRGLRGRFDDLEVLSTWDAVERLLSVAAEIIDRRIASGHPGHTRRATNLSREIARSMGLSAFDRRDLTWASYLQNIGQALLPVHILNKPGRLEEDERAELNRHPSIGEDLVACIDGFQPILQVIRHHHENFDGSGYPDGKQGGEIPLAARIIRVADAFDAMTSDRPHHKRRDYRRAMRELRKGSGVQFDPGVVDALASTLMM